MVPYDEIAQELRALIEKRLCPTGVTLNILFNIENQEKRREESIYLILSNEWDKVRGYSHTPLLKVLAKLPYARKFFWECRETAIKFWWPEVVAEWDSLLKPYEGSRQQDMSLTV